MTRAAGRLALPLALAAGCLRTDFNLATQQQEYSLTSTEKEAEIGRKLARQVQEELAVAADEPVQARVRDIGRRIAGVCDRKELVYTFTVLEDPEVNAFSLPGGYVFVNDGLIKKVANDDELAGVIAHEVAHITARHAVKRYEGHLGAQLAQLGALAASRGRGGAAAGGISLAIQSAQLSYARQDELEADRLAVKYLTAAEFDPKGMLSFLEKLHHLDHDRTRYLPRGVVRPHYAMTHPYAPERILAVKEALYGVADYLDYLNAPP
jgi:predicted Zn-dependent protease